MRGRFRLETRDGAVEVGPGGLVIAPRGVEHRSVAEEEVEVLLAERAGTRNTGNVSREHVTAPASAEADGAG
jgi:mannose-6-phosphate isomerase-like protein (cupin superfamily)